jgi:hypothetical protein
MALRGLRHIRRGRFPLRDCLQLLQELVGHEIDGWEKVDDALEDADGIADMHPFHTIET